MPEPRQRHDNPVVIRLHKQIAREIGMRDHARKRNNVKAVRAHDAKIIALRSELNTLTRKHEQVVRSQPQRRAKTGRHQIPTQHRDRHTEKQITAENAEQMIAHYRALLLSLATGTPFPLIMATRKAYTARLNEARRIARAVGKGGKAMFHKAAGRLAELARLHAEQAARASRLRAARRFAEADAAEKQATHYAAEVVKMDAATNTPGVSWEQQAVSPYLVDKAGVPTQQMPDDDGGASVEATAKIDEDGASASLDVDLPWYRRYTLPLGLAAVVGIGFALNNRKGKSLGAMRSAFTIKSAPMKVSRRVFRGGSAVK